MKCASTTASAARFPLYGEYDAHDAGARRLSRRTGLRHACRGLVSPLRADCIMRAAVVNAQKATLGTASLTATVGNDRFPLMTRAATQTFGAAQSDTGTVLITVLWAYHAPTARNGPR